MHTKPAFATSFFLEELEYISDRYTYIELHAKSKILRITYVCLVFLC